MAPSLKLVYFDFKGRAEPIRLALTIGGIPFEDYRFKREEWPALRTTLPFQAVPVLEVDGKVLSQSFAIIKYAGKLSGLYPQDPLLEARMDELMMGVEMEITSALSATMRMDDAARLAARKVLAEETLPRQLANLERLVGLESGWALGDKVSVADVTLYQICGWLTNGTLDGIPQTILDPFPKLKKVVEMVHNHPKVVEWNAAHPAA